MGRVWIEYLNFIISLERLIINNQFRVSEIYKYF